MDNINSNIGANISNPKNTNGGVQKILTIFLLVVILAVGAYFGIAWYQKYAASKSIPSYFTENSGGNMQVIKAEKAQDMQLESNESLDNSAVVYTENKSRAEVMQEFYKKIVDNHWMVIGGTTEESDRSVFKMTDGKTLMFITLEGKLYEAPTTVKIFKVLKATN